jgi:ferritin-like metal-binding protein YciE
VRRRLATRQELLAALVAGLSASETVTVAALGELVRSTQDVELAGILAAHREETRRHVTRLVRVQAAVGTHVPRHLPHGVLGLRLEAQIDLAQGMPSPSLRDRIVASSASRSEHDEIGAYRFALELARGCGDARAERLLARTLAEEERALADVERVAQRLHGAPAPV